MEKLSDRIKDFPTEQFIDWLCLSCVDVRASHSDELAQEDINKIREAVTVRLASLEDKLRIKQNHIRLRDSYIEELEERAEEAEAERDALADKLARSEDYCIGVDTERMEFIDKCNALAAENLALKSFIEDECYTLGDGLKYDGLLHAATRSMPITTATNSYANQLRAEGVEMVKSHPAIILCSITHVCEEIAAQLRAGKDGE